MKLPGVTVTSGDEARWADAESLLARAPSESAEQRLQRWRRQRLVFLGGVVLVSVTMAVVVVVLARGRLSAEPSVPVWQTVAGLVVAGAGLAVEIYFLVSLGRANRRLSVWRRAISVLSRQQRKELRAQIRGAAPIRPEQLPLARALAEQLLTQRSSVAVQGGLGVLWAGLWIMQPTLWRALLVGFYGLLMVTAWPIAQRDARRAQRFLEEHPASGE
jgi:hypothetical protein